MIPSFPDYIFINDNSIQRSTVNNVLRSEMEVGPQKTRPIQSVPMFQLSMGVSICADKFTQFNTWFQTSIRFGAYWFTMNDPLTGVNKRFRFVETEFAWSKSGNLLSSQFVLEGYDEL